MDINDLAKKGAELRIAELMEEIKQLQSYLEAGIEAERKATHWTQRPENRAKLAKARKKAAQTRRAATPR